MTDSQEQKTTLGRHPRPVHHSLQSERGPDDMPEEAENVSPHRDGPSAPGDGATLAAIDNPDDFDFEGDEV
ncbi:hypothetical protein C7445_10459 [Alicyclobacillus sacchari]|uniref:Uncharacterized protein n=1 Tax=Alicyclobacillus sacchari TaxID=392010 RepID=A0A4R8LQ57_9BACL|nr:hypothetical protein [Alicyclobacillus sacchari]TDY49548.1 hypothetical protein C7445_10459 [Alicyclobacillus sacchari]GMA58592.1 hypothetical protein GCM10025858_30950 [Alicyclobacillus sacchari]